MAMLPSALDACAAPVQMAATVEEILAAPARFEGRDVFVIGGVSESTVSHDAAACEHRFELRGDRALAQTVSVSHHACGEVLGLRADDLAGDFEPRVSVRGTVRGGVLLAEEVRPECWSKYDGSVLYMRACYEMAGIDWQDAMASHVAMEVERPPGGYPRGQ